MLELVVKGPGAAAGREIATAPADAAETGDATPVGAVTDGGLAALASLAEAGACGVTEVAGEVSVSAGALGSDATDSGAGNT